MANRTSLQFSQLLGSKVASASQSVSSQPDTSFQAQNATENQHAVMVGALISIYSFLTQSPQTMASVESKKPKWKSHKSQVHTADLTEFKAFSSTGSTPSQFPSLDATKSSLERYILLVYNESEYIHTQEAAAKNKGKLITSQDIQNRSIDDLQWAIVGYAALSVYTQLVSNLCTQTLPLSQDILYWDSIIDSSHNTLSTLLYLVQTTPSKILGTVLPSRPPVSFRPNQFGLVEGSRLNPLNWFKSPQKTSPASSKFDKKNTEPFDFTVMAVEFIEKVVTLINKWHSAVVNSFSRAQSVARQLFTLSADSISIKSSIDPESQSDTPSFWSSFSVFILLYSPLNGVRREITQHKQELAHLRASTAKSLGYLVGESFRILQEQQSLNSPKSATASLQTSDRWKLEIQNAVATLAKVLEVEAQDGPHNESSFSSVSGSDTGSESESESFSASNSDNIKSLDSPISVATKLINIIESDFRLHSLQYSHVTDSHGKPSWLVRHWPNITLSTLASISAARNIIGNWLAIVEWFRTSVVDTGIAFYKNWIIEPLTQIYNIIRHDDASAGSSLITKQSLQADVDSLERMVLQFAIDHGEMSATNVNISSASSGIDDALKKTIEEKVRQGDISSVLRPYEAQITKPIRSLITGDLIRSLLIQIQKTKVDIETAVTGIDKLIQSQQLVFGFVAALPSFLITYWGVVGPLGSWITGKSRRSAADGRKRESLSVILGRVDRILGALVKEERLQQDGENTGKFYALLGLLLCETFLLRDQGRRVLPASRLSDWEQDVSDLEDVSQGIETQQRVVVRIWNVYDRYIK